MREKVLLLFGLLLFVGMVGFGQSGTISGNVTDDDGEALIGATVRVEGTSIGAITDINGEYVLNDVPASAQNIIVSFVGFDTLTLPISGSTMNAQLASGVALDDVVIIGYGQVQEKDLTGAITSIKGDDIQRIPVVGIDEALQGRAAGVTVSKSNGQPGGGVSVRVRGPSSINSNNQPLYVIDGIPLASDDINTLNGGNFGGFGGQNGNTTSNINFADVESIQILKDASASAIYGSRAANGVVLITTKKGQTGKATFDVDYNVGTQQVLELNDLLGAADYITAVNEARTNVGLGALTAGTGSTDWQDELFRDALVQKLTLSSSGGSENVKYYTSLGYDNQEGTLLGTNYERISGRLNVDGRISDKFKVGNNLTMSWSQDNIQSNDNFIIGPYFSALFARPDVDVRTASGAFSNAATPDNPVAATEYNNDFDNYRILGNIFAEVEPVQDLTVKTSFGVDYLNTLRNMFWPTTTLGGSLFGNGYVERGYERGTKLLVDATANYNFDFGDDHVFNALAGSSWESFKRDDVSSAATGLPNDILTTFNSTATPLMNTGNGTEWGLNSFFGRVNYTLKDKYLLTASARLDGSSRFGENNQYGFFPSAAVAWRISDEAFLSDSKFVDDLKLRASWGQTGNNRIGDFAANSQFGGGFNYSNIGGIGPAQIANPNLQWETSTQYDLAVDFSLADYRLNGSLDFYLKETEDILLLAPLPRSSGFNNVNQNIGSMDNKGVELELNGDVVRAGDFTWNLSGNIAANKNEITRLVNGQDIAAQGFNQSIIREGEPLGAFIGHQVEGLFQTQGEIDALNNAAQGGVYQTPGTAPGDFKYRDVNGDGVINNSDRVILGSAQPDYFGGLTNVFSYNGLKLTTFFQFVQGNEIFNLTGTENYIIDNRRNSRTEVLDRWTPTNTNTIYPRAAWGDPNQNNRNSSFFVEDGSYIRLKTLSFSYDFPTEFLSKTKTLQKANIYFQGTNLMTITDYSGVDPEVNTFGGNTSTAQGVDNSTYPGSKVFNIGLNLGF